jgi:hypothetical protein
MSGKIYYFENFDIDVNSSSMLVVILGLAVGMLIAIILSLIFKSVSGKVVKALVSCGARDADSAKTVEELGLGKVKFLKSVLKPGSALYKAIACTSDEEKKLDYNSARFYLPEEKRISAEVRFAEEKHPVRTGVLAVLLVTAVAVFAIFIIPELLTMLDNLVTQLKPESNVL